MPVPQEVEVPDIRMQPASDNQRVEVVEKQRIAQAQQAVDRIGRRPTRTAGELKSWIDKLPEGDKILRRARSFVAVDLLYRSGLREPDTDFTQPFNSRGYYGNLFPSLVTLEQQAAVVELGSDNRFGRGQTKFLVR